MAEVVAPNVFGKAKERQVRRLERAIGARLPDDYREFLLATNGGEPTPDRWHIGPTEDRAGFGWTPLGVTVRDFFSLTGAPSYADLASARSTYQGRVPTDMLAVGSDDGGNLILLCTEGSAIGSVWYWDHENESPTEEPWRDNLLPLAPSFASFIGGLMTFKEHQDRAEADLRRVIDGGDASPSEPMA